MVIVRGSKTVRFSGLAVFHDNAFTGKTPLLRSVSKDLTLLHSERPKLYAVLAFLSAKWLKEKRDTVELQWLEHLWNHENMFETGSSS